MQKMIALKFTGTGWKNQQKSCRRSEVKQHYQKSQRELNATQQISENKVAPATVAGGPYIKNGYFYVPEWGFKFKIPSDLAGLGFRLIMMRHLK